MCLLHLVASLPTNAERLYERKDNNWNSLLRHSSYDEKARKKKDPQINSVSPLKRKNMEFFFPARFVHKSRKRGGRPGRRGGLSAEGPADGARGARGKRDLETNTFNHRFLCARQAKIRSKRRRETDGTYHHQVNT